MILLHGVLQVEIVLDREIQSVPYIDFVRNPDGIPGDNGAQIDMGRGDGRELSEESTSGTPATTRFSGFLAARFL